MGIWKFMLLWVVFAPKIQQISRLIKTFVMDAISLELDDLDRRISALESDIDELIEKKRENKQNLQQQIEDMRLIIKATFDGLNNVFNGETNQKRSIAQQRIENLAEDLLTSQASEKIIKKAAPLVVQIGAINNDKLPTGMLGTGFLLNIDEDIVVATCSHVTENGAIGQAVRVSSGNELAECQVFKSGWKGVVGASAEDWALVRCNKHFLKTITSHSAPILLPDKSFRLPQVSVLQIKNN